MAALAVGVCALAIVVTINTVSSLSRQKYRSAAWGVVPTDWAALRPGGSLVAEAADSTERVLIFSDYLCDACRHLFLNVLSKASGDILNDIAVYNAPVAGNSVSMAAAIASVCAEQEGVFSRMHYSLLQADLHSATDWSAMALDAGVLDTTSFALCVESEWAKRVVAIGCW
jgi:hypothetical protein